MVYSINITIYLALIRYFYSNTYNHTFYTAKQKKSVTDCIQSQHPGKPHFNPFLKID